MAKLGDAVDEVLEAKGRKVFVLPPEAAVLDAVQLMVKEGIGAVVVAVDGRPVGVFTERDYVRKLVVGGRRASETCLSEVMAEPLVTVSARTSVDECMQLMTVKRLRHLPIVEGGALRGLVSIGDLVKWVITSQERTIRQFEDYIGGRYPG
ncbi:CBS domain-containing protein [bacterium]|nr:MAG: CBS domain-containing protein [bacterium]